MVLPDLCKSRGMRPISPVIEQQIINACLRSSRRLFLLDYDGSLVPIGEEYRDNPPPLQVMDILFHLSNAPGTRVVIISGRDRHTLSEWFQDSGIDLCAEFASWIRWDGRWVAPALPGSEWKTMVMSLLSAGCLAIPGSFIEEKVHSLVWDYRASPENLALQAKDQFFLDFAGSKLAEKEALRILQCERSLLVSRQGHHKGFGAKFCMGQENFEFFLACGDDSPDEEMFRVMPKGAFTIRIGKCFTEALYTVPDQKSYLGFLSKLVASIRGFASIN
jgi:trehalose 6-phosphate synthase/phosphatase